MAKQAPDTDKGRDTLRDHTRFQLISTNLPQVSCVLPATQPVTAAL